jgi:hypothetical protein
MSSTSFSVVPPAPLASSTTSIVIPKSAGFIGSSDEALIIKMLVFISTTDRLRDVIRSQVSAASPLIDAIDRVSGKMNDFGALINKSWIPVTYASLKSTAADVASLRELFAADGPNLGETLNQSQAQLLSLAADGISLNAPKFTPLMVEQFLAKDGKVNTNSPPATAGFSWKNDLDIQALGSSTTPGSYPGSVVTSVENRDSNNKLISITRYTIFNDYANLRPAAADITAAFNQFKDKLLPILSELEDRLLSALSELDLLDKRVRENQSTFKDEQEQLDTTWLSRLDELKKEFRLIRIFRIELEKSLFFVDQAERSTTKNTMTDREDSSEKSVELSAKQYQA